MESPFDDRGAPIYSDGDGGGLDAPGGMSNGSANHKGYALEPPSDASSDQFRPAGPVQNTHHHHPPRLPTEDQYPPDYDDYHHEDQHHHHHHHHDEHPRKQEQSRDATRQHQKQVSWADRTTTTTKKSLNTAAVLDDDAKSGKDASHDGYKIVLWVFAGIVGLVILFALFKGIMTVSGGSSGSSSLDIPAVLSAVPEAAVGALKSPMDVVASTVAPVTGVITSPSLPVSPNVTAL